MTIKRKDFRRKINILRPVKMFSYVNLAFFILLTAYLMSATFTDVPSGIEWNYYHHLCPYSNFCTQNATKIKTSEQTNLSSCCHECSCDVDCQRFGICCPDFTHFTDTYVQYPCVDLEQIFNVQRGIASMTRHLNVAFHIIDDCPFRSKDTIKHYTSCVNPRFFLEDFILVTDKTNGRIYKNKHCAYCHGVQNYEEWYIMTDCSGVNEIRFENYEELNTYVMNNCMITPFPPKSQMTSKYKCILPEDIEDRQCFSMYNENASISIESGDIENITTACEIGNPSVNGMFYVGKWYANVYCYLCDEGNNTSSSYLCDIPTNLFHESYLNPKLTMIISHKSRKQLRQTEECNTTSIWDSYSNSCFKLFCPPGSISEYGKCTSVTVSSIGIVVTAAFSLEMLSNTDLDKDIVDHLDIILTAKLNQIQPCGRCQSVIGSNKFGTFIFYRLYTLYDCNRDYLLSKMEKALDKSMTLRFKHMSKTITARPAMITFTKNWWNTTVYSSSQSAHSCDKAEINVFESCARIDTRTVPLFADNKSLSKFDGIIIDHKVCISDYYKFIESLSMVSQSVIYKPVQFSCYFIWLLSILILNRSIPRFIGLVN